MINNVPFPSSPFLSSHHICDNHTISNFLSPAVYRVNSLRKTEKRKTEERKLTVLCVRYIKGRRERRYTIMSECADKLKQKCQKSLPLHEMIPEEPENEEEDPYTMVQEMKALADKVCTDGMLRTGQILLPV